MAQGKKGPVALKRLNMSPFEGVDGRLVHPHRDGVLNPVTGDPIYWIASPANRSRRIAIVKKITMDMGVLTQSLPALGWSGSNRFGVRESRIMQSSLNTTYLPFFPVNILDEKDRTRWGLRDITPGWIRKECETFPDPATGAEWADVKAVMRAVKSKVPLVETYVAPTPNKEEEANALIGRLAHEMAVGVAEALQDTVRELLPEIAEATALAVLARLEMVTSPA